ncbi:hypothetical protein ESA_03079 [Cronobacter sakazakii ATCC BAA-894]|uniref:Uncharacterized protein n=1 Tax=Cronobacter sakazakii (strain ATCC BAA-894) TaxID=290339 RepID=A7MI66_CROS8|nr:hypothetical protein ESA_03079 [Cronobacter sakazakii ATCC BAA-894]
MFFYAGDKLGSVVNRVDQTPALGVLTCSGKLSVALHAIKYAAHSLNRISCPVSYFCRGHDLPCLHDGENFGSYRFHGIAPLNTSRD